MNEKFIQRSLTTLVGLPIVILIIWINSYKNIPILVIFTSIIAFFAIYEICKMAKKENIHINPIITSSWGAILIFSATGIHSNINSNIVYFSLLAKISLLAHRLYQNIFLNLLFLIFYKNPLFFQYYLFQR